MTEPVGKMDVVYLDNNATTMVAPEVLEEMLPYFSERYGNPSSMHSFGGEVAAKVEEARERVATFLHATPTEIVFTGCGTESDNMAIRGVLDANPQKRHIITTRVEHPAVLNLCQHLAKDGYRLTEIGVDHQGNLDIDELDRAITDDTAIVSVMWANNETGVVFPIDRIAAMVRARGVVFHCDAVQAAGKIPVNLRQTPIDLLSIAGHKIHAPKGVGVLYVRRGTKIRPLMIGGHQERGRRPGTENTASIIGLGKACELAGAHIEDYETRVRAMRDRLEEQALATCPDSMVNGDREARVPNTTNLGFEYVEGEAILLLLNETGICASSGSACTSGSLEPSHVLRAMGVPFTCSHGSVRFSLSRYTTEAEIDHTLKHLPPVIQRLREISPFTPRPAVR